MLLSKMLEQPPTACADARRGAAFSPLFSEEPGLALLERVPPPPPPLERMKLACNRVLSEASLLLLTLASATLATLLIVRPAFVLKFEQDQKRPWRGCTRISWVSVLATVLIVAALPFLLSFLGRSR
jgi:hypothetical protein